MEDDGSIFACAGIVMVLFIILFPVFMLGKDGTNTLGRCFDHTYNVKIKGVNLTQDNIDKCIRRGAEQIRKKGYHSESFSDKSPEWVAKQFAAKHSLFIVVDSSKANADPGFVIVEGAYEENGIFTFNCWAIYWTLERGGNKTWYHDDIDYSFKKTAKIKGILIKKERKPLSLDTARTSRAVFSIPKSHLRGAILSVYL